MQYRSEAVTLTATIQNQLFNKRLKRPLTFLDSAQRTSSSVRWSILAENPSHCFISSERAVLLDGAESMDDPIALLSKIHHFRSFKNLPPKFPWPGGIVALSYDLKGMVEDKLQATTQLPSGFPDIVAYFFDRWLCVDHQNHEAWVLGVNHDNDERFDEKFDDFRQRLLEPEIEEGDPFSVKPLSCFPSETVYKQSVQHLLEGINEGDYYQANLSRQYTMQLQGDVRSLYTSLRRHSPNPFNAFMEFGSQSLLSASPEQFVKIDLAGELKSCPIKGTRPRSKNVKEDNHNYNHLLNSAKDKAELAMIVDLIRNDLGRFCELGSVKVPQKRRIERYTGVHHTAAIIEARVSWPWQLDSFIKAMIPGGSITGAPKIAAIQELTKIEPKSRGFYSGNLLLLDALGRMDSSILIRTLVANHKELSLQVGGGIVSDSQIDMELQETKDKAYSLLKACGLKDKDFT